MPPAAPPPDATPGGPSVPAAPSGRGARRLRSAVAGLVLGVGTVSLATACATPTDAPGSGLPGATTVRTGPVVAKSPAPAAVAKDPQAPVTFLGRTVFPKCHRMSVGRVVRTSELPRGAEIVQVAESEVLWGTRDDAPIPVICGAVGLAPDVGATALFLLRLLPSGSYEAVQIAPLDDDDGPARLEAFRRYLAIEALPDAASRRSELAAYLRNALTEGRGWTRANAIREYEAFSSVHADALGPADADVLARAAAIESKAELRKLLQATLDRVPSGRAARNAAIAAPAPAAPPDLGVYERRLADRRSGPGPRRQALIDAAVEHGARCQPLVAAALADDEPLVREAAAAIAGESGITVLGPKLVERLRVEDAVPVRRTLVLSLGHLQTASAVPLLSSLTAPGDPLARDATFALARIRDAAAVERLDRLLRESTDAERIELLRFLLSDDFVRQERALGSRWAAER